MFARSCPTHTIARIACKIEYIVYVISKHMCMNIMFYQTVAILRSGIICFFDITNYLHEHKKSARRADCNFCLTNHPNKCTILEEPRTTRLDIKYAT